MEIFHVVLGRSQRYLFLLRYHRVYWISAVVTAVGAVGTAFGLLVSDLRSVATPSSILGLLSTLFGLGLFLRDAQEIQRVQRDLYPVEKPITSSDIPSVLRLSDTYSSHEMLSFRGQPVMYSPIVNTLLRERSIPYQLDTHRFRMNAAAWFVAPLALRRAFESSAHIFNSPKVRLRYDPTEQAIVSGKVAVLQRTDYFTELCTNAMVECQVLSKADNALRFDGVDLMANHGIILDLEDTACACANIIGISTLAFTRDGYLIISVQGRHTQKNAGYLAPSGSGSADLDDLKGNKASLQEFIRRATERELHEECGLSDRMYTMRTELIGFCRVLNRGGMPEFFSVSFIDADHGELRVSKAESPYIAHIDRRRINRESTSTVLDEVRQYRVGPYVQSFSLQLYLNLLFLEDYLESDPASFEELVIPSTRSSAP